MLTFEGEITASHTVPTVPCRTKSKKLKWGGNKAEVVPIRGLAKPERDCEQQENVFPITATLQNPK